MRLALLLCLMGGFVLAADDTELRAAFEAHHWFDLRDAVSEKSAPFYRVVVAAAFNDIRGAEKAMSALQRSGANKDQLTVAEDAMSHLYRRNGFYRRAAAEVRKFAGPPAPGESNADWGDLETIEKLPDIAVASRRSGTVAYSRRPHDPYLVVPLNINGQPAEYVLDTGASISLVTESEAKRLGLTILAGTPTFDGITGGRVAQGRYAYAARLKIANTELRDVAFLVVADNTIDFLRPCPNTNAEPSECRFCSPSVRCDGIATGA